MRWIPRCHQLCSISVEHSSGRTKKNPAVRQLQGTSVHVCAFESFAILCSTESPCKQDDITFYFPSFLVHSFISISPVITNWQHMLAFSSIVFNIPYREISAKVSLFHWHVRQHWKYSPTRKIATSTIYPFILRNYLEFTLSRVCTSLKLSAVLSCYLKALLKQLIH